MLTDAKKASNEKPQMESKPMCVHKNTKTTTNNWVVKLQLKWHVLQPLYLKGAFKKDLKIQGSLLVLQIFSQHNMFRFSD